MAAHLCPPTAIGWKARASHLSKPCRATSALAGRTYSVAGQAASSLHSMAELQVFQAKMLANEEASLDSASLRDLMSATDLALRATKATAQAIGRSMSSRAEVMNLLEKGAIENIPPAQSKSGFYSAYFLVPKKDGSLRPILDFRLLNYALMKRSFRMITLKQIQICPGDWFKLLDLKDAYFYIQVAPHHRRFFRFVFEGVAYQYKVLPFGLFLTPRTLHDA